MKPKLFIIMLSLLLVILLPLSACAKKDDIVNDGDGDEDEGDVIGCAMPNLICKTTDELIYAIRQAHVDAKYFDVENVITKRAKIDRVYVPDVEIEGFVLYAIYVDSRITYQYYPENMNFDDPLLRSVDDSICIDYCICEIKDIAALMEKHAAQFKTPINEEGFIYVPEYRTIITQIGDTYMSVDIGKNLPESLVDYEFMKSLCEFTVVEME